MTNRTVLEPMLLELEEKHDTLRFLVRNDVDLYTWAARIVAVRMARGWYDDPSVECAVADGASAWGFLARRSLVAGGREVVRLVRFDTGYN